jgi:gliding motility-associated-like protein
LLAQLTAPGSKALRFTSYSPKDPIFFYCNETGAERGTLKADRLNGTGTYDFSWFKWNDGTNAFSISQGSEPEVSSSTINNLLEGGYKVVIDSSGIEVKSYVCWIFFDEPPVASAVLANPLKNCDYVALDGEASATVSTFSYKNPSTGTSQNLANELTHLWSSVPSSIIPLPDYYLDPVIHIPPLEDVTYTLKVNTLGCSSDASFFYESIHVNADFTADPVEGEAPDTVRFSDNSRRGYIYTWDFGDGSDTTYYNMEPEDSSAKDTIWHTFYKPGEYSVLLTLESQLHCIDSVRFNYIKVLPSELDIPNFFTPNEDGYNDWFKVESKSMRFISMEVYSQSGMKVYGFSGSGQTLAEWTGWDGKVNNSSTEARPGVYFYIIRGYGWDDIKYDSKEYRGFVYLYR